MSRLARISQVLCLGITGSLVTVAATPAFAQCPTYSGGYTYYYAAPTTQQPAPQVAAPKAQVSQSNPQNYQSFSAEPETSSVAAPVYSYPSYPAYGYGFFGSPSYYGGSGFGSAPSWRSLDNANHHGTSW
jgi:hypothetical protein